jgi:hypothetical protein
MFLFPLWIYLLLRLVRELARLALIFATYPWSFWIAVATLVISLFIAATTGGILLWKKCLEHRLKLEYYIVKNPARVSRDLPEEHLLDTAKTPLRCGSYELIYFKIRNMSKLVLSDNSIWIDFDRGFTILDEDKVNELPEGAPLGTLHEQLPRKPLLDCEKRPTFKNLMWGKGKEPTLLMPWIAFYDPCYKNQTTMLRKSGDDPGDLFIPVWVKTPEESGEYPVKITVKLRTIDKDLAPTILMLHVR